MQHGPSPSEIDTVFSVSPHSLHGGRFLTTNLSYNRLQDSMGKNVTCRWWSSCWWSRRDPDIEVKTAAISINTTHRKSMISPKGVRTFRVLQCDPIDPVDSRAVRLCSLLRGCPFDQEIVELQ